MSKTNINLQTINGSDFLLGSQAAVDSISVVSPSDSHLSVNLSQVGGTNFSLGAQITSASIPVNIATTQLPLQTITTADIATIGSSNITLGQKTAASSIPVVVASNQSNISVQPVLSNTSKFSAQQASNIRTYTSLAFYSGISSGTTYQYSFNFAATHLACAGGTAAATYYIYSDNSADTNKNVFIEGYDNSGNFKSETVTTNNSNGTTPVATANTYVGISKCYSKTSTLYAGNVYISDNSGGGTTRAYGSFASGFTKFNNAGINLLVIPSGMVCYITEIRVSGWASTNWHYLSLSKMDTGYTTLETGTDVVLNRWAIGPGNTNLTLDGLRIDGTSTNVVAVFFRLTGTASEASAGFAVQFSYTFATS